eukprot:c19358_g1_i1.p1 GENE.c19358_g1_i1~~c19358_g1_i1.p1  ORF type:complete len:109 (+),score=36.03 c19358_g1_i1:39-365(+)
MSNELSLVGLLSSDDSPRHKSKKRRKASVWTSIVVSWNRLTQLTRWASFGTMLLIGIVIVVCTWLVVRAVINLNYVMDSKEEVLLRQAWGRQYHSRVFRDTTANISSS